MSVTYLDWDKLRVFSAVAELKSLTSAAKRLGESTPTVSRKIDDLERKLNCELLIRTPRGVELTEAGRVVEAHAQTMNEKANSIWNDVCALDIEGTGRIRMAAGDDGVMGHWLTRGIPHFQDDHPGIELELTVNKNDINLLSGDADLTIAFEEPRQRDLVSLRLGTLHYMCFASQEYLDKHGAPESLYDFQGHKSLIHTSYVHQVDDWSPRVHELQKLVSFAVTTNSGSVMKEVCAQGGGIAVMPSYVAEIDSRLVPLSLPELAPARFWLVYTQRLQRLSRGRIVIDWIRRQFSPEKSPWFMDTFVHPNKQMPDRRTDGRAAG